MAEARISVSLAVTLVMVIIAGTTFIVRLEGKVRTLETQFQEIRVDKQGPKGDKGDPGSMCQPKYEVSDPNRSHGTHLHP